MKKLLSAVLLYLALANWARANVYATHIRLNGSATNSTATGGGVNIGYILNEDATLGVTIQIMLGATPVRTITLTNGSSGTVRGTNIVRWDGTDNSHNPVGGTFLVSITAAASGYSTWTQISEDTNFLGNGVWEPTGIAVNRNTNSPYYGRVFVANAIEGPNPDPMFNPSSVVGIQKLNADGSPADEGGFSDGGWTWAGDGFSPWKIEVSSDDMVYVSDLTSNGMVLRFDETLSTNSRLLVLRDDNWPNGGLVKLSGPFITGTSANTQVWMADTNYPGGAGIRRWNVSADGNLATNDTGTTIVQAGGGSALSVAPYDVALDANARIYAIQYRSDPGDPTNRIFRFPAYGELGSPETVADWQVGGTNDSFRGASGIAVNPAGSMVAVGLVESHATVVLDAATGTNTIARIDTGDGHAHRDVAWDNVGNLYDVDDFDKVWRVYSPPGTNQATTVSLQSVHVPGAPVLTGPARIAGQFQFTLNGEANVTYVIQASTNLQGWLPAATNTSSSATRLITLPAPAKQSFYRAKVAP